MDIGKDLKNLLLAGIGAVAITAEKSQEMLDELVKKGELTVEQGKVLNEELKHNVEQKIKESVTVQVTPENGEELLRCVDSMTPEQLALLKKKLESVQPAQEEETPKEKAPEKEEPEKVEETTQEEKDDGAEHPADGK